MKQFVLFLNTCRKKNDAMLDRHRDAVDEIADGKMLYAENVSKALCNLLINIKVLFYNCTLQPNDRAVCPRDQFVQISKERRSRCFGDCCFPFFMRTPSF